ncbi:hypothetical protein PROFUN_07102 [Planoprotostelium fungivorum]|uniref:Uncharacterized protein n=1 Tax=Planoprotostelium fungivorum TaxID=1890364 RepID=A0A2P6NMF9_9EUKA|nr:hypothetical protein PROFUN_07102 [Planoprotostelium fungivorum]
MPKLSCPRTRGLHMCGLLYMSIGSDQVVAKKGACFFELLGNTACWNSVEPGGQTLSNPHHPDSVRCTRCPDSAKIGEKSDIPFLR